MLKSFQHPTLTQLKKIKSLTLFSDDELLRFSDLLDIQTAQAGEKLIQIGATEQSSLFVLLGEATKEDTQGRRSKITSENNGFYISQAPLRPSIYHIEAVSHVEYMTILANDLNRFTHMLDPDASGIDVDYIEQSDEANNLTFHIFKEIIEDKIRVPAMPEVSLKIQKLFDNDNAEVGSLSELIQTDPSLSARILRVANSPLYCGTSSVDSISQSIVRMGLKTLRNQVIIYAISEMLVTTSFKMKMRMRTLWRDSRRVSAFSRILSQKLPKFNDEAAQMAGLLCNLGTLAIVQYIQDNQQLSYDEKSLDQTIINLRPQINSFLMHKWNLGDELIAVAEESHDWFRNQGDQADLCDVILIARYFSYLNTNSIKNLPVLSRLPAYEKLKSQGFRMSGCMQFVKESQAEVAMIENMLGSL